MSETILMALGAVGFLGAGVGLGFWLSQARTRGESAKADEVQRQFDDYKQEVTQHFGRTAEHFKAIGREYRELYEHMASGADALCAHEAADVKLSFAPKAILESIADEDAPQAPRDFAQDDAQTVEAASEVDEALETGSGEEPDQALAPDTDVEPGDKANRTLH